MVHLSHLYRTAGKTIALTIQTFVSKVMSLLFTTLCRFVIAFLQKSKHLLISWLQSPSAVISESKKIKFVTAYTFSPSICNAGDMGSIPGSGRSSGEGNGNPLQYSGLENPMDGGARQATFCGVAKSWTRQSD